MGVGSATNKVDVPAAPKTSKDDEGSGTSGEPKAPAEKARSSGWSATPGISQERAEQVSAQLAGASAQQAAAAQGVQRVVAPQAPPTVNGVSGPSAVAPTSAPAADVVKYVGGIDRRQFYAELQRNPGLMTKMAWMVRGEVGNSAPLESKIAMLETAFNRAQVRGHSLDQALWSVGESRRGYYARDTYRRPPPSAAEVEQFKKTILAPVLAGSNVTSKAGLGPMTGNASADVAAHQRAKGTPGYGIRAAGGQTEYLFNEEHKDLKNGPWLKKLDEANATAAAQQALTSIPQGVLPVGPAGSTDELTGNVSAPEAAARYGSGEVGSRGNARGRRTYNPTPMETPTTQQTQTLSALMQMLAAMGLSMEQIQALLQALGADPEFQAWLNGRQPTEELMQQFLTERPAKLEALMGNPTWKPTPQPSFAAPMNTFTG